jgi:DNA-binding transcriptional ArsR family regulator
VLDLAIIDDPAAAAAALDPIKSRLLAELATPASAANLATRVGMPRQKIRYHLQGLETHGLVRPVSERQWGGLTERLFEATATSYVVSPRAMGAVAVTPARTSDRQSASYLVALAARVVREVGDLWRLATQSRKRLATLSFDGEVRFASAAERAAFTQELTKTLVSLVARYHTPGAGARAYRLLVLAHPKPSEKNPKDEHADEE